VKAKVTNFIYHYTYSL